MGEGSELMGEEGELTGAGVDSIVGTLLIDDLQANYPQLRQHSFRFVQVLNRYSGNLPPVPANRPPV